MNTTHEAIRITRESARAQVKLLASIAPLGRWGMGIAKRNGITLQSFTEDDTRAIYAAHVLAEVDGTIRDTHATAKLVRDSLRLVNCWNDADDRSFISGMSWGPGSLGALFYRLAPLDAEHAIPRLCAEIQSLAGELEKLQRSMERAA